jgi:hypothetical protein
MSSGELEFSKLLAQALDANIHQTDDAVHLFNFGQSLSRDAPGRMGGRGFALHIPSPPL